MKRGTASRVILGKNTIAEMPGGVFVGTDVILGKKDGLTNDFNGLVLLNTVMLGKKVSHAAIISVIVRGANRIVLPDAIANSLSYVKAFGGTEQNGTPTPDYPMDIVSNNGVMKARHQSGLPLGYTLLEYIESTGTQYIDTGIKGNGTTKVHINARYYTTTSAGGSGRIFGSRDAAAVNAFAVGSASGTASTSSTVAFFFGNQRYLITDKPIILDEWLDIVFDKTTHNINGIDYGDPYNDETFETPQTLKIFGFDNSGTMGYGQVDIARCKLWDNGVLIRDLVPCKNASNVVGMYDLVNDQFYNNDGTGDFVAGATVDDIEVYADGTVETINVHGKNLFDVNNPYKSGYAITQNGSETRVPGFSIYSLKAEPLTTYTYSCNYTASVATRIHSYDKNGNWIQQNTYGNANDTKTFTTTSNTAEIRISINNTAALSAQLELGSTATEYAPYYDGGIATAEMLLKVGDYQDEQQILSGAVTRNVGVKVFDGTERWARTDVRTKLVLADSATGSANWQPYCTHYQGFLGSASIGNMPDNSCKINVNTNELLIKDATHNTDLATWKQFLADQYAAGTPVIVIYPLATPTTESVTGQTLQVQAGDNVLEITQASLTGLELEAQYNTQVQLTVQEVESANLDNDVTVTIL